MNYNCIKFQTTVSIVKSSLFLETFGKQPIKALKVVILLSQNISPKAIRSLTGLCLKTIYNIKNFLIMRIKLYFNTNPIKLGGPGAVINIDETMLNHKIKAHRGRTPKHQVWALTIVDTTFKPSKGFAKIVTDRSKAILLPIIKDVVRCGSIIYTDEWKSYTDLSLNFYEHRTICHKYHFVDPSTQVHTQHIESFNNKIKS